MSAWALPRPSAIASAKLANMTVRTSQTVIDHVKMPGWAIASSSVMIEPTSTTNITGLRTCTRGSSLANESDERLAQDLAVEEAARLGDAAGRRGAGAGVVDGERH